jgi:hypothetical protein
MSGGRVTGLRGRLDAWVAAGLITADQAERIEANEATEAAEAPRRRTPYVVAAGHVLALATVAGLLVAGVARRQLWLLAVAAFGVLQVVPQTAVRYLPASAAAPLALFVVGVLLVGTALWLARSSRAGHGRASPGSGVRPGHRAIRTGQ